MNINHANGTILAMLQPECIYLAMSWPRWVDNCHWQCLVPTTGDNPPKKNPDPKFCVDKRLAISNSHMGSGIEKNCRNF